MTDSASFLRAEIKRLEYRLAACKEDAARLARDHELLRIVANELHDFLERTTGTGALDFTNHNYELAEMFVTRINALRATLRSQNKRQRHDHSPHPH